MNNKGKKFIKVNLQLSRFIILLATNFEALFQENL